MTDFVRQTISAEAVQATRAFTPATGQAYKQYLQLRTSSRFFDIPKLLAILQKALGKDILLLFLKENAQTTLQVAARIIDDHMTPDNVSAKDLQVNLVANIIIQVVRAKNMHKASSFGYGEDLIRNCKFDAQFKLSLKMALFDGKGLESPFLVISHHHADSLDAGVWMRD